jgi:multicomponent Na+:H+ antiporter subunit E
MIGRFKLFLLVLLAYLALTANGAALNWVVGAVVAAVVTGLTPVGGAGLPVRKWPEAVWALSRYAGVLVADMIRCGVIVAQAVLRPRLRIKPGLVEIPSYCRTALGNAWSAHAISITPGELVVEVREDGTLVTHTLDIDRSSGSAEAARRRHDRYLSKFLPGEA